MQLGISGITSFTPHFSGPLMIIPGANGYGMQTRGPYAGSATPTIYHVYQRGDSGAGSLRQALEATEPRFIVFDISGYIEMQNDIYVSNSYWYLAGETAPAPGITIRMSGNASEIMFLVDGHDWLIHHIRVRPGAPSCNSAFQIYGNNPHMGVIGNCSISWGQDEGIFTTRTDDFTVWRTIVSEMLNNATGSDACTGGGLSNGHGIAFGDGVRQAGLQNILAHCDERNYFTGGGGNGVIHNNIFYDSINGPSFFDFNDNSELMKYSATSNYFRRGPDQGYPTIPAFAASRLKPGAQLYLNDNTLDNGPVTPQFIPFILVNDAGIDPRVGSPPITLAGYTPMSAATTYTTLPAIVGARPTNRDVVDIRTINEVLNRTGRQINTQDQVGGYPSLANNLNTFVPVANPHVIQASGYSNLEVQLHQLSAILEGQPVDPGGGGGGNIPSASGTRITSGDGNNIIDANGNVWNITAGFQVLINGADVFGAFVTYASQAVYYNNNIYVFGDDEQWYYYNAGTAGWDALGTTDPSS